MNQREFEERKNRIALTLLSGGAVFAILLAVVLLSGCFLLLLVRMGFLNRAAWDRGELYAIIGLMVLLSVCVGGVVTFAIVRVLLRPINSIINAMNRLAAGDFQTRIRFGTIFARHPTVVELTDSFNKMAAELEGTQILRSDFINNFSHEFKTPIVSIAGFARLLRRDDLTAQERAEYLDIIEDESLRLAEMATNVLNMTKVENQAILTDVTRFNLSEQLRNCVLLLERKWSEKALELNIDMGEYFLDGNEELLRQVWVNLLDNAVKFAPVGARLDVAVRAEGEMLAVMIGNTGSTIPPDKIDHIFGKFYQADESHAAHGNGIGLAIVKSVTELHGGSVSAQSGQDYTQFTVKLPARHPESL